MVLSHSEWSIRGPNIGSIGLGAGQGCASGREKGGGERMGESEQKNKNTQQTNAEQMHLDKKR